LDRPFFNFLSHKENNRFGNAGAILYLVWRAQCNQPFRDGNLSAPKELLKRFDEKYLPPLLPLRLEVSEYLKIKQHHFKGL